MPVDIALWGRCGLSIYAGYLAMTAIAGEVYRPRGVELHRPAFYLLFALPLAPLTTYLIEKRKLNAG
jgi:hypothetical protein